MYTNARAAKLLRGFDREMLWELVAAGLAQSAATLLELPIALEGSGSVACEPIVDGGVTVGVLLRFQTRSTADDSLVVTGRRMNRATFGWDGLNENELSVAALVAEGLSNREAAARLFVSRHTVDFHLRQIYQKLGIHSRVELARIVIDRGALTS